MYSIRLNDKNVLQSGFDSKCSFRLFLVSCSRIENMIILSVNCNLKRFNLMNKKNDEKIKMKVAVNFKLSN